LQHKQGYSLVPRMAKDEKPSGRGSAKNSARNGGGSSRRSGDESDDEAAEYQDLNHVKLSETDEDAAPMTQPGLLSSYWKFMSGEWLQTNDDNCEDPQDQVFNEATNVGLLAALMLSVVLSMLTMPDHLETFQSQEGEDNGERMWNFTGTFMLASSMLYFCSIFHSLIAILAVNELENADIIRVFVDKMGGNMQLTTITTNIGTFFCFVSVGVWFYVVFDTDTRVVQGTVGAVLFCTAYYFFYMPARCIQIFYETFIDFQKMKEQEEEEKLMGEIAVEDPEEEEKVMDEDPEKPELLAIPHDPFDRLVVLREMRLLGIIEDRELERLQGVVRQSFDFVTQKKYLVDKFLKRFQFDESLKQDEDGQGEEKQNLFAPVEQ